MNLWQIDYWNPGQNKGPVEKWLDKLSKEQFQSIAKELSILEQAGSNLKLPHSKALGKGLFELRERKFEYRIYYTFRGKCMIILLAAGDKKSQENDIKMARKRLMMV